MSRQPIRRMLILFSVMFCLSAAMPLADTAAAPGGNSANARACQKGNWATLAPVEDPGTAFTSQDECVSYAANGGSLTAYVAEPPSVTVTMLSPGATLNYCIPSVEATGFTPNTDYLLDVYHNNNGTLIQYVNDAKVTADENGNMSFTSITYSRSSYVLYQAIIGGVESNWAPYQCTP